MRRAQSHGAIQQRSPPWWSPELQQQEQRLQAQQGALKWLEQLKGQEAQEALEWLTQLGWLEGKNVPGWQLQLQEHEQQEAQRLYLCEQWEELQKQRRWLRETSSELSEQEQLSEQERLSGQKKLWEQSMAYHWQRHWDGRIQQPHKGSTESLMTQPLSNSLVTSADHCQAACMDHDTCILGNHGWILPQLSSPPYPIGIASKSPDDSSWRRHHITWI